MGVITMEMANNELDKLEHRISILRMEKAGIYNYKLCIVLII